MKESKLKHLDFIIVDDEPIIRKGIINSINWELEGFKPVGEGSNGIEALKEIEKHVPDIVITDIKMPFMDGLELCQEISRRWPRIRIVILTGYDDFEYARQAIRFRVSNFILKPVGAEELVKVLSEIGMDIRKEESKAIVEQRRLQLISENLPILQREFILSICGLIHLSKKISDRNYAPSINVDLCGPEYQVYLIEFNSKSEKKYETDAVILFFNRFFNLIREHGSVVHKCKNIFLLLRNRAEESLASIPFCHILQEQSISQLLNRPTISIGCKVVILIRSNYRLKKQRPLSLIKYMRG